MEIKDCSECSGLCCKYVAMEIDVPEDLKDFENIRWYVAHKNISVYVEEDGSWNVEFLTPCVYLTEDNKCNIHEDFVDNPEVKRPNICREFTVDQCPYHNEYSEVHRFEKIEDVDEYIENIFKKGMHVVNKTDNE